MCRLQISIENSLATHESYLPIVSVLCVDLKICVSEFRLTYMWQHCIANFIPPQVLEQCCEGGAISPSSCRYMKDWLKY